MTPIRQFLLALTTAMLLVTQPLPATEGLVRLVEELLLQDPKTSLVEARRILEELRASEIDPDGGVLGNAAAVTGAIASKAGAHEEAVELLLEGLPVIAGVAQGQLLLDEYQYALCLVRSLKALERDQEAVDQLKALLERAQKGVAIRARMERPAAEGRGKGIDASDLLPTNGWLLDLQEQLGDLQMLGEDWAGAEQAFEEAERILTTEFPDEQKALLAKMQENRDIAARKQGKKVRPRVVGRFGHPRAIRIEGATQVTEDEIRSALLRSGGFVLSSHPAAKFEEFRKKVQRSLVGGYQQAGFPEVEVTVDWDHDGDDVVATIKEGTRYRIGQLHIEGAGLLSEEVLRQRLTRQKGMPARKAPRAERTFRFLEHKKRLPEEVLLKVAAEKFPWLASVVDPAEPGENPAAPPAKAVSAMDFEELEALADDDERPWEPGKWISHRSDPGKVNVHLAKIYADEGRSFSKFETEWVLRKDQALADLRIKVIDEGRTMELGAMHVVGNKVNTREELLDFLGLKKGMRIDGSLTQDIRRKLFDSGRFKGWELMTVPSQREASHLELLVIVAEHWEAPPLSAKLTREQEAWRKFATWCNGLAMEESDLVIALDLEDPNQLKTFEIALGAEGMGMGLDMRDQSRVRAVIANDGEVEVVLQTDRMSLRSTSPITSRRPLLNCVLQSSVGPGYSPEKPQDMLKSHSFAFGAGVSSVFHGEVVFGLDPATALDQTSSLQGFETSFQNGVASASNGTATVKFEEATGRLLEFHLAQEIPDRGRTVLTIRPEKDAINRLRKMARVPGGPEVVEMNMNNPVALGITALGSLAQLLENDLLRQENPKIAAILNQVGRGMQRWEPVASAVGDFADSFKGMMFGDDEEEEDFYIPTEFEDMALLQGGSSLILFLGFGGYDILSQFVEPGTWPDRVMREAIHQLGGQPHYLNETAEELLADDSMGPLGSLVCAGLLQKTGHGATRSFLEKAQAELTEDGFAKDWRLVLNGTSGENGPGWRLLKSMLALNTEDLDDILPGNDGKRGETRGFIDALLGEARDLKPNSTAEAVAPAMDRLWKLVEPKLDTALADRIEKFTPRVDAREVAATVRGRNDFLPLFRGTAAFMERIASAIELEPVEGDWQEECLNYLLFARQIWFQGMEPQEEQVNKFADMIVQELGADGWQQVANLGLTKAQCRSWVRALLTGSQYRTELLKRTKIPEEDVKAFYEQRKDLFREVNKRDLLMIMLKANGNIAARQAEATEILKQVKQQPDIQAMRAAFEKLGGHLSRDSAPSDFHPVLAAAITRMNQKGLPLSDVITITIKGTDYIFLVLFPEEAKVQPFKEVAEKARAFAIIDREAKRLREMAQIDRFEMPAPGAPVPPPAKEPEVKQTQGSRPSGKEQLMGVIGTAMDAIQPTKPKAAAGKATGSIRHYKETRQKAEAGSAEHLYYMGTFAERGIGKPKGMEAAADYYRKAAEGGDVRAMMRLAELHRTGRGVPRNEAHYQAWKKKAAEARAKQPK